jgi:hypothetical protein
MTALVAPSLLGARGERRAAWQATSRPGTDWAALLERCGGSFFHSPPALRASLPPGEPVFARLVGGGEVLAVAAGVMCGCRLSLRRRHARFAALPAAAPGVDRAAAAALLARALAAGGAAEVAMDSFASPGGAVPGGGALPGRERWEWVVPLSSPAEVAPRLSRAHRRHATAGDRAGWTLRELGGSEAARLLAAVQDAAAGRAARRGDPFGAGVPGAAGDRAVKLGEPWGVCTFAAYDGAEPLAAALVGWANRRAFYLVGGSTPEGYRRSAAPWLHARVMERLAGHGFAEYDLGGTAAEAAAPAHPAHGLHRFKAGFGAEPVPCRGARWEPGHAHLRAHRALARLATLVTPGPR